MDTRYHKFLKSGTLYEELLDDAVLKNCFETFGSALEDVGLAGTVAGVSEYINCIVKTVFKIIIYFSYFRNGIAPPFIVFLKVLFCFCSRLFFVFYQFFFVFLFS